MTLEEFARIYFANHPLGIKKNTQDCYYLPAARMFDRVARCKVEEITKEQANIFVDWLRLQPKAPATQRGRRRAFATLWLAAHDAGLSPEPSRFRRIAVPQKSPVAWSFETVQKLVRNVIDDKTDWINGIQYGTYWASLFSAAWDSALRLGDLLSIEYGWIQKRHGCGFLRIIQSKTQREHQVQLNKCTMRLIERSIEQSPHRRLIWPLKTTRKRFYRDVKAIINKANESGSFRYFRRSAVTFAESQSPGSGQRLAAHRDSRTTRESYIDPMLLPNCVVTVKPLSR